MSEPTVAVETEIRIDDTGAFEAAQPTITTVFPDGTMTKAKSVLPDLAGMNHIRAMIEDPDSDPVEVSRNITYELSVIATEMVGMRGEPTSSETWKIKTCAEAIKALKELRISLLDTEAISKKDILRFDGEKFKFFFGQVLSIFTRAMKEAGLMEEQRNSIMKHYRDLMAIAEPTLRRETEKMGEKSRK